MSEEVEEVWRTLEGVLEVSGEVEEVWRTSEGLKGVLEVSV